GFLIDHAGLPEEVVLEQIEILGREIVPVLRREFEARRPAGVPSRAPSHEELAALPKDHDYHQVISSPVARAAEAAKRAEAAESNN
ncbi:hypothetical protein, partial [Morganella morganii]